MGFLNDGQDSPPQLIYFSESLSWSFMGRGQVERTHRKLTAHPPTWVGILLTVWLLLTVGHEYGGVAGYDMLALGIGYSRFIKVFYQISIFPLLHF